MRSIPHRRSFRIRNSVSCPHPSSLLRHCRDRDQRLKKIEIGYQESPIAMIF
ncbi:hypothetical protein DY000_02013513 [Brassica cretica]|uniref:Uncharacterized protein n=1 Tax=Brassica cretica TaxID=69181 RepID=A0ABQ7D2D8_BRACR|nr:hypothetical protein DY000_02013513 [Brassica cretica]